MSQRNPAALVFNITAKRLIAALFHDRGQQTSGGGCVCHSRAESSLRCVETFSESTPKEIKINKNTAPPDKGLHGEPGSMLIVEMVPSGRASRSSGLEHQVLTVIPLSQPHLYSSGAVLFFLLLFYCRALMMSINKRGVSIFTLSA